MKNYYHVSKLTYGKSVKSIREEYGLHIFGKISCHAFSVLKLSPQSKYYNLYDNLSINDFNSICTLARALIDTYYVFYYLIVDNITQDEFEFRYTLWLYQGEIKRFELLNLEDVSVNEKMRLKMK